MMYASEDEHFFLTVAVIATWKIWLNAQIVQHAASHYELPNQVDPGHIS